MDFSGWWRGKSHSSIEGLAWDPLQGTVIPTKADFCLHTHPFQLTPTSKEATWGSH